jgi:hypothetical protein
VGVDRSTLQKAISDAVVQLVVFGVHFGVAKLAVVLGGSGQEEYCASTYDIQCLQQRIFQSLFRPRKLDGGSVLVASISINGAAGFKHEFSKAFRCWACPWGSRPNLTQWFKLGGIQPILPFELEIVRLEKAKGQIWDRDSLTSLAIVSLLLKSQTNRIFFPEISSVME